VLHRYATRRSAFGDVSSPTTLAALGVMARIVLWVILALITLDNLGVHIQTLVAGLGISGIAVALAVQNVLGDAFAALSIITDKPFVVGDTITVDTFTGTVENIGLKTTRLRSITGEQLVFSNADLLKSRIRNWKRMNERGVYLTNRIGYETPRAVVATIPGIMREIIEGLPRVRFARSHVKALADASIEIETLYFVMSGDMDVYLDAQQAVALATLDRFGDAGVVIATPLHTIVMRPDKNWNAATNSDNGVTAPVAQ
jgi:small-conductance mechanosensitive channel